MLLEKICEELGIEIGEKWIGNDGKTYAISSTGKIFQYDERGFNIKFGLNEWGRILTGKLKPKWKPEVGEKYYIPYIHSKEEERQINYFWDNSRTDKFMWNNNLMFKTKEEAITATNKIIKLLKEDK